MNDISMVIGIIIFFLNGGIYKENMKKKLSRENLIFFGGTHFENFGCFVII